MGYRTRYHLSVVPETKETLAIKSRIEASYDLEDEVTWYDWESDMADESEGYKDILFVLRGNGEESGDVWRCCFLNGEVVDRWSVDPTEPPIPQELVDRVTNWRKQSKSKAIDMLLSSTDKEDLQATISELINKMRARGIADLLTDALDDLTASPVNPPKKQSWVVCAPTENSECGLYITWRGEATAEKDLAYLFNCKETAEAYIKVNGMNGRYRAALIDIETPTESTETKYLICEPSAFLVDDVAYITEDGKKSDKRDEARHFGSKEEAKAYIKEHKLSSSYQVYAV